MKSGGKKNVSNRESMTTYREIVKQSFRSSRLLYFLYDYADIIFTNSFFGIFS